ncbi:MAG: class I SAM-dependent methyltransferase [Nocardioidaceae bacterium]
MTYPHESSAPSARAFTQSDDAYSPIYQHPLAYLLGVEGIALMKAFAGEFGKEFTTARLAELRALLDAAETLGDGVVVPPMSSTDGYDGWASTYDDPGNGLFDIEGPPVRSIIDQLPVGFAVDAACGTGRHTEYLSSRGHRCAGLDTSPQMLAIARAKVPAATFATADIRSLPLATSTVDLVVCAVALAHLQDLAPAFREFARILAPGGHLVVSDTCGHFIGSRLYPLVKWDLNDEFGYVPTWQHRTGDYLRAALPQGFLVRGCEELMRPSPPVDVESVTTPAPPEYPEEPPNVWALHPWAAEATNAAYRDHPAAIVWHFQLDTAT